MNILISSLVGSALDLNFSDINVACLDKDLEEQENNIFGYASKNTYNVYLCVVKFEILELPYLTLISSR